MELTDLLARAGGFESMARELGVDEGQVATGAAALLPAILGGFKKQAQAQPAGAGLGGLGDLLGQLGGGSLLDNVLSPQPTDVGRGNDVLGQIFGSPDVSRTVAHDAASRTGLDAGLLKQMLPMLAMLVTGYMAKHGAAAQASPSTGSGGLGDLLGGLLGGLAPGAGPAAGATAGATAPGLGAMLDLDGNGNPLDDILRLAGRALR